MEYNEKFVTIPNPIESFYDGFLEVAEGSSGWLDKKGWGRDTDPVRAGMVGAAGIFGGIYWGMARAIVDTPGFFVQEASDLIFHEREVADKSL